MFTDTAPATIELLADSLCAARLFMVGGGGESGGYDFAGGSGAGSGYLKYSSVPLTETTTVQIQVGDHGEASTVTIDGVTLKAAPGADGSSSSSYGGYGFSGGAGGFCNCQGGSNGGDGEGELGGQGTGEQLSSFPMDSFILTPGVGGQYFDYGDGDYRVGGGGGGVLINGNGPEEWDIHQGQGYGGGGSYKDSQGNTEMIGLRGVILLQMVP